MQWRLQIETYLNQTVFYVSWMPISLSEKQIWTWVPEGKFSVVCFKLQLSDKKLPGEYEMAKSGLLSITLSGGGLIVLEAKEG